MDTNHRTLLKAEGNATVNEVRVGAADVRSMTFKGRVRHAPSCGVANSFVSAALPQWFRVAIITKSR